MPDEMDYYFSGEDFDDDFYTDAVITSKSEAVAANAVNTAKTSNTSNTANTGNKNGGNSKFGSVLAIIFISLLAAALLGAVIYSLDKRNTLYNQVSSLNNQLHLAEAENVRLQSELESQMSAKNVEDYAENVLGMRKIDSSQIEYIKIRTGDVVTIPEKKESVLTRVRNFFDECVEYFRGE